MPRKYSTVGGSQPNLRKDGCYEQKVTVGRDPVSGKLIRKTVYAETAASRIENAILERKIKA